MNCGQLNPRISVYGGFKSDIPGTLRVLSVNEESFCELESDAQTVFLAQNKYAGNLSIL
jgi:hypothetical protein